LVNERRFAAALRAAGRCEDVSVEVAAGQLLSDFIDRWLEKKPCA
jgi:hypothetical protein